MRRFKKIALFSSVLLASSLAYAECSFKVVNHSNQSFTQMGAKASIGNLAIVPCPQLADQDDAVKANCAAAPDNTLYSHPHTEVTCRVTNGWPIYLQFETSDETVCTAPQETTDHHIVANYPEDFKKC